MRNLFFDIESANNINMYGNICEFGYVLVDDNFEIIQRENIIINPNTTFEPYVKDHILTRPEDEYLKHDLYPSYFDKIANLFKESRVFGHTVDNDAKYLNKESKRYNLPYINYTFFDIKLIYEMYSHEALGLGLLHVAEKLKIKYNDEAHDALSDATLTYLVAKKLCELDKCNFSTLAKDYGLYAEGNTKDGVITLNSEHVDVDESEPLTFSCSSTFAALKDFIK